MVFTDFTRLLNTQVLLSIILGAERRTECGALNLHSEFLQTGNKIPYTVLCIKQ